MTFLYVPHLILVAILGIHSQIVTVRKVSVKAEGSISIPCRYEPDYKDHVKYLCKGYFLPFCSDVVNTNQQNAGKFSISDDKEQRIFTVTIKDLTDKDTDYWCAVKINRGSDVGEYFHLSVTRGTPSLYVDKQKVAAFEGGSVTVGCRYENADETKWCRLGSHCVAGLNGSIDGTKVTINASVLNVFTLTMSELRMESGGWYWCDNGDFQMPVHVTVIEQLTTGIHSQIVTVRKVSVKAGRSISIPCHYDPSYTDYAKYLCKGYWWPGCSDVVNTSQSHNSGKFSISDDTNRRIFTVTVNDPTDDGSEYWCAMKIDDWPDVGEKFQLSVTRGTPSLYVDKQEIAAFEGGSVTVGCRYDATYADVTKWCRLGRSCVTGLSGKIDGTRVTINASVPNVFTVTMSELRMESGGWYWCDNGDFQMPVHITFTTTTTTMSPNTANFTETPPNTTQHSSLFTSAQPHTAQPTNSTINGTGGENLQGQHKSSTMVAILTPTLILLLLMVPAAFIGCRIRRGKTKPEGSDITAGSQIGGDPDVNYATIVHKQHAAAQQKGSPVGSDPDVNYATIVLKQHAAAQQKQNKTPEESVTYSTIVMKEGVPQTTEPVDGSVIYSTISAN